MNLPIRVLLWNSSLVVRLKAGCQLCHLETSQGGKVIFTQTEKELKSMNTRIKWALLFCFVVAAASEGFYVLSTALGLLVHWGCWLCAHSPHRLFTSTDALDLCKFLNFLPTETVIKTISHYFLSCFPSKLLSFEESQGI